MLVSFACVTLSNHLTNEMRFKNALSNVIDIRLLGRHTHTHSNIHVDVYRLEEGGALGSSKLKAQKVSQLFRMIWNVSLRLRLHGSFIFHSKQ